MKDAPGHDHTLLEGLTKDEILYQVKYICSCSSICAYNVDHPLLILHLFASFDVIDTHNQLGQGSLKLEKK